MNSENRAVLTFSLTSVAVNINDDVKDLFSRIVFGFVMAQILPGAVVAFGIYEIFLSRFYRGAAQVNFAMDILTDNVSSSALNLVFFVLLSLFFGMGIHGLHWSVLGFVEHRTGRAVHKSRWHRSRIIIQMLLSPIQIIYESICFLINGRWIIRLRVEENLPNIGKDKFDAFQFLQDFYLYFAQFYAHMSYALLFIVSVSIFLFLRGSLELSIENFALVSIAWLICGAFFIFSRIQFASLFNAEHALKESDSATKQKEFSIFGRKFKI